MSLHDRIMRARQAQVDHEQRHDVQLAVIPFANDPFSDERFAPEITWATANEVRDHFHGEIDHEWREWMVEHYPRHDQD